LKSRKQNLRTPCKILDLFAMVLREGVAMVLDRVIMGMLMAMEVLEVVAMEVGLTGLVVVMEVDMVLGGMVEVMVAMVMEVVLVVDMEVGQWGGMVEVVMEVELAVMMEMGMVEWVMEDIPVGPMEAMVQVEVLEVTVVIEAVEGIIRTAGRTSRVTW
jgi:hypothetical protein